MKRHAVQLGVHAGVFDGDPRLAAAGARVESIPGVLFDVYGPHLSFTNLSDTGRREIRQILGSQGRQLVGLRVAIKGIVKGMDIDRFLSRMASVLESAADLLSPLVCLDLGLLPQPPAPPRPQLKPIATELLGLILLPEAAAPPPPPLPSAPADLAAISLVQSALAELGALADRFSVRVAFCSPLAGFAALSLAVKSASCPWFGIDLDPPALLADEWTSDDIFSDIGPLIFHVQGRDAQRGSGQRLSPAVVGQGSVDWPRLLADLDSAGYRGWLTIDTTKLPEPLPALRSARALLESIML